MDLWEGFYQIFFLKLCENEILKNGTEPEGKVISLKMNNNPAWREKGKKKDILIFIFKFVLLGMCAVRGDDANISR